MKSYYIFLIIQLYFMIEFHAREIKHETVYIVPESFLSTCDREPCITLSDLVQRLSINVNTTKHLIFLPGYHILDSDTYFFNTTEFSLISSNDYPSFQVSITCQHNSGFSFENIGRVMIGNLTFIGCGNTISSCGQLLVEGSTFLGHNGSGTALEVIKTSVYIVNSSFISNRGGNYHGPIKEPFNSPVSMFAFVEGAVISNQSDIIIINGLFEGNCAEVGGAIFLTRGSNVTIMNSVLSNNSVDKFYNSILSYAFGGALFIEDGNAMTKSSIALIECELHRNHAEFEGLGGVIFINNGILNANSSKFHDNVAYAAGVLLAYDHSNIVIDNCEFLNNIAWSTPRMHSGVIAIFASVVSIYRSLFDSNRAIKGGVMTLIDPPSIVTVYMSEFKNSYAMFGGVIVVSSKSSSVTFIKSLFDMNVAATQGGVIESQIQCTVTFVECIFSNNRVNTFSGGAINMAFTKKLIIRGSQFLNNLAINFLGGAIHLQGVHLTLENTSLIENKAYYGGALHLSERSFVKFKNLCRLANNTAFLGGAILAFDSILHVHGNLEITSNTANVIGGGAMLSHCEIICRYNGTLTFSRNIALKDGGGVYSSNSYIIILFDRGSRLQSAVNFTENRAGRWGGGIFLLMASSLHIEKKGFYKEHPVQSENILYFVSNSADRGGAIYVEDETNYGTCSTFNLLSSTSNCFIQVLTAYETPRNIYDITSVKFESNKAVSSGSILFGGLLDRCTPRPDAEILKEINHINHNPLYFIPTVYGFTYFQNISNIEHDDEVNTPWVISSLPVRVCFCQPDNKPNCSFEPDTLRIEKGEKFNISLVAVDQVNHTMRDTVVYSSLRYKESGLGVGQVIQTVKNYCTPLNFSIHSPHDKELLMFYPEGPCRNASKSLSTIKVKFINCTCPIGFQVMMSEKANCVCECDSRLLQSCITECNISKQTLVKKESCWISLLKNSHYNKEYLIYSDCPSDYCHLKFEINLNTVNGSDVQCANHRTGILCGLCKPDLSLSLGSSRCIPCSRNWPVNFALILLVALVSGVALVAIIMILNLTVAIGTLNGLIFYANIINSSKSIFYIPSCKVYPTIISWLNLDIGFDVCFYKGLDTYWKTWLQLVFPIYVISLVMMIIILSRYSMRFSMLIAKKNPVATLATLILLSYTKLLHIVIVVLSKANLQYSDHTHTLSVWLFDPTVKYGRGKHISLFIMAILILIVGIFYTFLLLFWQWLLKCVKYQRLCHFIDPYHAPYRFKHRYWTGLLLLARVAIYIIIILYGHGDPNTNLLAITFIVSFLLILKGHLFHRIYKNRKTDMIESICYLNIVLFSAIKIIILNTSNQRIYHDIVTNISGLIIVLLLAYVLIHHLLSEIKFCEQCWKKLKIRLGIKKDEETDGDLYSYYSATDSDLAYDQQNQPKPTSSIIEGHLICDSEKLSSNKINASAASANIELVVPLLGKEKDA